VIWLNHIEPTLPLTISSQEPLNLVISILIQLLVPLLKNKPLAVCPADSKVLSISQVTANETLLVKGVSYSIGHFLTGIKDYKMDAEELNAHHRIYEGSTIYSCILYLAPGDYHRYLITNNVRYHCPTDYTAKSRTHIVGSLAPVKESYISKYSGVYEGNERVVLQGEWS